MAQNDRKESYELLVCEAFLDLAQTFSLERTRSYDDMIITDIDMKQVRKRFDCGNMDDANEGKFMFAAKRFIAHCYGNALDSEVVEPVPANDVAFTIARSSFWEQSNADQLLVELKESIRNFRDKLRRSVSGPTITASFPEVLEQMVVLAMKRFLQVTGEAMLNKERMLRTICILLKQDPSILRYESSRQEKQDWIVSQVQLNVGLDALLKLYVQFCCSPSSTPKQCAKQLWKELETKDCSRECLRKRFPKIPLSDTQAIKDYVYQNLKDGNLELAFPIDNISDEDVHHLIEWVRKGKIVSENYETEIPKIETAFNMYNASRNRYFEHAEKVLDGLKSPSFMDEIDFVDVWSCMSSLGRMEAFSIPAQPDPEQSLSDEVRERRLIDRICSYFKMTKDTITGYSQMPRIMLYCIIRAQMETLGTRLSNTIANVFVTQKKLIRKVCDM